MTMKYANNQPKGFSNHIKNVTIVGAGGHVGKHIAEQLLENDKHIVTAITRPNSGSKLPEGLRTLMIDYSGDDDTALVQALQGQHVLIITMAVTAPRDAVTKLIRAAAKAGVPYIMPNWFGHDAANNSLCNDSMLTSARDSICSEITSLGVSSYILLVCGFWYEFSLGGGPNRYGFDFQKRSLVLFDGGSTAINTSTWAQCGRAVSNLLSLKEMPDDESDQSPSLAQFCNSSIYISSFLLDQREMFESVKRVTNTTDADWDITHDSAEARFKAGQAEVLNGNFKEFPKMLYSRMFFPNGDGNHQARQTLHNEILNLPTEDLDKATAVAVRMGENGEIAHDH